MFKMIILGLVAVVVAVLGYAATRPDSFVVTRATTIQAPPEAVFALVNDLTQFQRWSPWAKKDPAMVETLSGPAAGVGAALAWSGNSAVGAGRMTITESVPAARVAMDLDFQAPMVARNAAEYTFAPQGTGTVVTWSMRGPSPYMAKVIGLFASIDSMVGPDFEAGLANLKTLAEAP